MKSLFDIRKDRKETLISCSKDKFGPEKKKLNLVQWKNTCTAYVFKALYFGYFDRCIS